MNLLRLLALITTLLLSACSESPPSADGLDVFQASPSPEPTPIILKGDLPEIRELNYLRIVAPRFDGADALPRQGLSVRAYQALAEEFAASLHLDVRWVYVDGFDELIPSVNQGLADLIVTNMSVTDARSQRISFSRPITKVSEVVVALTSEKLTSLDDLEKVQLVIPSGTAYEETVYEKKLNDRTHFVGSDQSDIDVLGLISTGQYQATIMDSDVAKALLSEFPKLEIKFKIRKKRPIAWAVRHTSPELLRALNEFLVSHHVIEAAKKFEERTWEQIKTSGRLRMLTLNNPASYFMWRGELMGFDYELMKVFTEKHNLHLSVIIKNNIPELIEALKNGEGDVIASSLTKSRSRENLGIRFSRPYLKVKEQVVGKSDGVRISELSELNGKSIGLNPNTVFYNGIVDRLPEGHNVKIVALENTNTESLIEKMMAGEFEFTVADSHLVALEQAYHQQIDVNFDLDEDSQIAWATRKHASALTEHLNTFIKREYRGLHYNILFNKYFKNARKIKRYQDGRVDTNGALSPYDNLVKELADKHQMDWRLVISQMYQESKFDPNAKSFAGAMGLMQVLPRTAKELGYSDLYEPRIGISAGVDYMKWLEDRFPGDLAFQEKIFFTLAAYNAGVGHVRDARRLVQKMGFDHTKWFDNVENAMLLLSKPEYYKKSRFGYVRGKEPVEYVRKIHDRYLGYLQSTH